ncbi:MAG TPA: peptide ABC transporter substrate-binding protein [Candidatus Eremiobacteraceae bacterium]|nr:peptide ABC transporter substrate-binding protein [Candidatus Eremiobacteraceae bacterium]
MIARPGRAAAFALFAAAAVGLSACTPSSAVTEASIGSARPRVSTDGLLRMAGDQKPDNLNPLIGTQVIDTDLSLLWGSYLFLWNDQDQFVPELATAVPTPDNGGVTGDGLTIMYHLRTGVVWQDGAPFTAKDVIFSWRQVMNPRNDTGSRQGYDQIKSIDAPNAHTLVVHLKRRYAPFVATFFSMSASSFCILPEHLLSKYADLNKIGYDQIPVGTGPFRVTSNADGRVKLAANPLYWRGAPGLKEIDYQYIASDEKILEQLKAQKIDFYEDAAQALEPELHGIGGTTVYLYPFTRWTDVGLNLSRPQLRDPRVRHALAYAIDREGLVEHVTHGVNFPADSDQPPFFWAHDNALKADPYDPAAAARLLDAAGWRVGKGGIRRKNGIPMNLEMVGALGDQTISDAQRYIQREWLRIGVRATITNYASDRLYDDKANGGIEQNGRFDVAIEDWANGVDPDESQLFMCAMAPPAGWNIYHYCDRKLDAAENSGIADYRIAGRKRDYDRVQQILAEDLPIIVLWFQQRQDVATVALQNYRPAHAVSPFWNAWQWKL